MNDSGGAPSIEEADDNDLGRAESDASEIFGSLAYRMARREGVTTADVDSGLARVRTLLAPWPFVLESHERSFALLREEMSE